MTDPVVRDELAPLLRNDDPDPLYNRGDQIEDPVETIESNIQTPLPVRSIIIMVLLIAMTPLAFEVIFPFINQMILEVGIVDSPEEVGFYSGLIESIFACLSLMTGFYAVYQVLMPIGYLADRIGRKPIILGGTLATAMSTASFGMSKTLLAMILSRCIGGAAGSVWVAIKTVMAEYTDKTNQGKAFQYLTVAYRGGQILGLPLGGLLAHPERNFYFFQSKFWIENPFALPCFIAASAAIFSVILGYFFLDETLRSKRKQKKTFDPQLPETIDVNPDSSPALRVILTPQVVGLLLNNVIMCFVSEVTFAIFPLFSFTPISSGGMGLNEATIGLQLSIRAFLQIGMMLLYSNFERYFKTTVRMYRATMFIWPVALCCMPALNALARIFGSHSREVNLAMLVFFIIWGFGNCAWTSMHIMVTDASPSESALSTINGLCQVSTILPQALAPATATVLFAYSIQSQIAGGNLIWVVLFVITCVGAVHSLTLKEATHDWRIKARTR